MTDKQQSAQRNGAFDLLKVLSILIIVLHHYALHSGWSFDSGVSLPKFSAQTLLIGGKLGVDLFVMITGYFLVQSRPKVLSLVNVWLETTIIAVLVYFATVWQGWGGAKFSIYGLIRALFPVIFVQYWFVTSYTLMYLLTPLLNRMLRILSGRQRLQLLIPCFLVLSFTPFIHYQQGMTFSWPIWFVFLYLVGGSLRLATAYVNQIPLRKFFQIGIALLLLSLLVNVFLQYSFGAHGRLSELWHFLGWTETVFYTRDVSPLMFGLALVVFCLFMRLHLSSSRILVFLSKSAFGVYLLQSAPIFSVKYLWPQLVHANRFTASWAIIGYGLVVSLLIYLGGTLMYAVLTPLQNLILSWLKRPCLRLQAKLQRFYDSL